MGDASFGPMWPYSNPNIVTLVRNDGLRLPIHKELAELMRLLMDATETLYGYDILPGQTWGYANRAISGTNTPSNHSQGTATDINAPSNPYASADWHRRNARGTFPFGLRLVTDIPQKVIELWEAHGFRWGGKYTSKPDPMHFEFMGTVSEARAYTITLREWLNEKGDYFMGAEDQLERLIKATNVQTKVIQRTSKLERKQALKRELREARRNNENTQEIVDAINSIDTEEEIDE